MEFWMVIGSEATPGWILRTLLVWHKLPYLGTLKYSAKRLNCCSPRMWCFLWWAMCPPCLKKEVKHKALVILNMMCAEVRVQKLTIGVKKWRYPLPMAKNVNLHLILEGGLGKIRITISNKCQKKVLTFISTNLFSRNQHSLIGALSLARFDRIGRKFGIGTELARKLISFGLYGSYAGY